MYKNKSNPGSLSGSSLELSRIVSGTDIFNSQFLYRLTKFPNFKLKKYTVTILGHTPSSIAKELYGDFTLSWIITVFNPNVERQPFPVGYSISYPDIQELIKFITS